MDAIIAETGADLASASLVRDLGEPVLRADFGAQTPTHFVERRVDPDYEWNTWALGGARARGEPAQQAHEGRADGPEPLPPRRADADLGAQGGRDADRGGEGHGDAQKVRYVGGLRGAPAEAKMHVVSLELDLGQPHEF